MFFQREIGLLIPHVPWVKTFKSLSKTLNICYCVLREAPSKVKTIGSGPQSDLRVWMLDGGQLAHSMIKF